MYVKLRAREMSNSKRKIENDKGTTSELNQAEVVTSCDKTVERLPRAAKRKKTNQATNENNLTENTVVCNKKISSGWLRDDYSN